MALISGKKGMDFPMILVSIVLAILVIVTFALVFAKQVRNAQDNFPTNADCPGTCKERCVFGEIKLSEECKQPGVNNGEPQEGKVCCATPKQMAKKKDTGTPTNTGTGGTPTGNLSDPIPQNTKPVIEIRLDDNYVTPISGGSEKQLTPGVPYTFRVWGAGTNIQKCEIRFLKEGKTPVSGFLSSKNKGPEICVDPSIKDGSYQPTRQNIMFQTVQPESTDEGYYQMQVLLYDNEAKIAASASIGISVPRTSATT